MTRRAKAKLTASEVVDLLRKRYPEPAFAFLEQVADGTGATQRRWADAVAIGLWPSRGLDAHGFEVKVSRADWRKELADPAKAESVQTYCDFWWIVCPPGVISPGELPGNWGHIEAQGATRLVVKTGAPKLEAKPWDRKFFAAIARRASELETKKRHAEYVRGLQAGRAAVERDAGETAKELAALEEAKAAVQPLMDCLNALLGWGWERRLDTVTRVRAALQVIENPIDHSLRLASAKQWHEQTAQTLQDRIFALKHLVRGEQ